MRVAVPLSKVLRYPGGSVEFRAREFRERMEVDPIDGSCDEAGDELGGVRFSRSYVMGGIVWALTRVTTMVASCKGDVNWRSPEVLVDPSVEVAIVLSSIDQKDGRGLLLVGPENIGLWTLALLPRINEGKLRPQPGVPCTL